MRLAKYPKTPTSSSFVTRSRRTEMGGISMLFFSRVSLNVVIIIAPRENARRRHRHRTSGARSVRLPQEQETRRHRARQGRPTPVSQSRARRCCIARGRYAKRTGRSPGDARYPGLVRDAWRMVSASSIGRRLPPRLVPHTHAQSGRGAPDLQGGMRLARSRDGRRRAAQIYRMSRRRHRV